MDPGDLVGGKARCGQPVNAPGVGPAGPEAAKVERGRPQGEADGGVVELGVVGERDDGGAGVRGKRRKCLVRPVVQDVLEDLDVGSCGNALEKASRPFPLPRL